MSEIMCHCGKPLHYSSEKTRTLVDKLIAEYGETVLVTVKSRSWLVPRHYIALHGLSHTNIEERGFQEVENNIQSSKKPRTKTGEHAGRTDAIAERLGPQGRAEM